MDLFPQCGKDMIAGDDKKIVIEFFDEGKFFTVQPDLQEYILYHFFGYLGGFGEGNRDAIYVIPMLLK
jgi:hypothetical protein